MCGNYPNCNCPSCTQCQDCTQVTPTCNCTTTCTCSTEQFTEECPNGLQSTNCLIYTGDNLKDCDNNDYLFRGTNFNTFLSQLWETVKCAATATTDTIDYVGADIKDCSNTITIVTTNTPVTTALNNIWNYIKCWKNDLQTLITNRQPIWTGSSSITVGSSQPAPYNNINTALAELAKYHFNTTFSIYLEDGNYGTNNEIIFDNFFNDKNTLIVESLSGIKENVIIKSVPGTTAIELKKGNLIFRKISLGTNNANPVLKLSGSGTNVNLEEVKLITNPGDKTLIDVSESASINLKNCTFVDTNPTNLTNPLIVAKTLGNVIITGGSYTTNKVFCQLYNGSLNINNSSISFTNLAALNVIIAGDNSSIGLLNTPIINSNPSAFNSNAFVLDNSTLECYYNYNTSTDVISGFNLAFLNINGNIEVQGYNKNPVFKVKGICNNIYNSNLVISSIKAISFDYTQYSYGVYNQQGSLYLTNCDLENARFYTGVINAKANFSNNTLKYNNTFYTLNPTSSQLFSWEDGGNTSWFTGNTIDLNSTSIGLRSSVQSTQFWTDDPSNPSSINTFLNNAPGAAIRADFSSVIYSAGLTGIAKVTGLNSNSVIY